MKDKLQEEITQLKQINQTIKSAAFMVGYDVDKETDKALEGLDDRIKVNIWQRNRIKVLESLLEDL